MSFGGVSAGVLLRTAAGQREAPATAAPGAEVYLGTDSLSISTFNPHSVLTLSGERGVNRCVSFGTALVGLGL